MTFFENLLKKDNDIDIQEFLNKLDEEDDGMYDNADAFVKPIPLNEDTDLDAIMVESKAGNIVLLDIQSLLRRNALKLKTLVNELRQRVESIDGDIARISEEKIIVTPHRVKIYKKRSLL